MFRHECLVLARARLADELSVHPSSPAVDCTDGGGPTSGRYRRVPRRRGSEGSTTCPTAKRTARLLERHRAAADLLVGQRRQPPEPVRRLDVVVVDRARDQREQQPERARDDERGEQVHRARAGGEPVRLVRSTGHQKRQPGDEVLEVLEVQQRLLVPERRVVHGRDVPGEVRPGPERQRDQRDA